jgi:hypothetical protein
MGIVFHWFPSLLPGTIKVDSGCFRGLDRGVVGVIAVCHYLLRQRIFTRAPAAASLLVAVQHYQLHEHNDIFVPHIINLP